ncbi:2,4-dihydroxyhept-2-ene-1,7-dioic acid aldolase [Alicyclobacillus sp. TC]|uniref:4-hydroxy-tetrahydrodipicolinate synthase n=1 Tax=Alicyclobacillus tolerans TaxID=90970 RepID=A0A1M6XYE0_9BACL|nr:MULTISPECIES: 2,4-dihydroxyhept-2-ene-1,7-dioic acid aldolase [Alicyclobacillus]QRF22892.1 2,4-dihydroxyhept-2-ene-1,7-dioic acid aldolase [Alicyclobacillus sp. TC]SHL11024.1 4-hydroxy-tetrahydrodipicolinate synthase [Alicyclobacillus montanus]
MAELVGSIAPMVTPFLEDGSFDETTFRELIEWHIDSGTHGISCTGTTGEPSSLSIAERKHIMEVTVDQVRGRVPTVLGTGSTHFEETLELTLHAQKIGADAALVIVPYYSKPSQEGLYQHFCSVADAVDIPIVIYNIPGRTGVNMEPTTMARLRKNCPNIIGVKESNKNFEQISHVLHACGRDFNVYSGIEELCYPMLALGGKGHISATANLMPREVSELYNLCAAGKWDAARDLHFQLLEINQALFWETNPGPLKACMAMMGKIRPVIRKPLVLPDDEMQDKLRNVLQKYSLI